MRGKLTRVAYGTLIRTGSCEASHLPRERGWGVPLLLEVNFVLLGCLGVCCVPPQGAPEGWMYWAEMNPWAAVPL